MLLDTFILCGKVFPHQPPLARMTSLHATKSKDHFVLQLKTFACDRREDLTQLITYHRISLSPVFAEQKTSAAVSIIYQVEVNKTMAEVNLTRKRHGAPSPTLTCGPP